MITAWRIKVYFSIDLILSWTIIDSRSRTRSFKLKSYSLGGGDSEETFALQNAGLCDGGGGSDISLKYASAPAPTPAVRKATASVGICGL